MPDSALLTGIGLGLSALGLAIGLYQYRTNSNQANKARGRERAIMAADRLAKFHENKDVIFAMRVLDHGRDNLKPDDVVRVHELPKVLRRHWVSSPEEEKEAKGPYSDRDRQIRDSFDGFLTQLETVEHLIENDVISEGGFGELFSYWLILLGEIPVDDDAIAHLPDESRKALWTYIRTYQFNGVVRLFARYRRAAPVGTNGFKPRAKVTLVANQ